MRTLIVTLALASALGAGFLVGSQARPQTELSQLAGAQLMTNDKRVEWIGYSCGDDRATVIAREMPSTTECLSVRRLDDHGLLIDQPLEG